MTVVVMAQVVVGDMIKNNMKHAEEIIKPFEIFLKNLDYKNINNGNLNPDVYLFQKWAHKVPKGWYGFSLGSVPFRWAQILDDFLTEAEKENKDFEIHQIKLKMGGCRIYLGNINEKTQNEINKLENCLFSEDLIY